jgi:DNA-binding response OmpR family regulator
MQYVFQQNFTIKPGLLESNPKTVLLVEVDPEASAMYARHLSGIDVTVAVCGEPFRMLDHIAQSRADLMVFNPMPDVKQSIRLLREARSAYPSLPVISIGGTITDQSLDALMAAGVTMHINRYLTQPRDLSLAVQQILS